LYPFMPSHDLLLEGTSYATQHEVEKEFETRPKFLILTIGRMLGVETVLRLPRKREAAIDRLRVYALHRGAVFRRCHVRMVSDERFDVYPLDKI